MAVVQGALLELTTPFGVVTATPFYQDNDGRPVRIDMSRTAGRPYRYTLRLADGSRETSGTIANGNSSVNITGQIANQIDMRPYGDGPGEIPGTNPTSWLIEVFI